MKGSKAAAEQDLIRMLVTENKRLRKAGCKLAVAALRVATEYDGVHRLMLATSKWVVALANENGRGERNKEGKK